MRTFQVFTLIVLLFLGFSVAGEKAGEVVKKQGRVKLFKEGALKGESIKTVPVDIHVKDILKTSYSSMAFVKLLGVNKIVLMENSVLYVDGIDRVNFEGGRAIFQIRKREEGKGIKVRVKSVIIGIKGTKFMVSSEGKRIGIFLKEGNLTVRNMVGDFIRYKKKEEEEFEEFRKEIERGIETEREEFEKFKRETEKEFKEFVKEFELKSGSAVVIDGNEVRDIPIPQEVEEEFKLLDMF